MDTGPIGKLSASVKAAWRRNTTELPIAPVFHTDGAYNRWYERDAPNSKNVRVGNIETRVHADDMTQETQTLLNLRVPGQPVGKARPRVVTNNGAAWAYTPVATEAWERRAGRLMQQRWRGEPLNEPVALEVRAVARRPLRLMRRRDPDGRMPRTAKPDGDNVLKIVADALTKAQVLRDDVVITDWRCLCQYAAKNEEPCVEVLLRTA